MTWSRDIPGCVICIVGATPAPAAPLSWSHLPEQTRAAELIRSGIAGGATTSTAFVFVYGVDAARAALCREHRAMVEAIEHQGTDPGKGAAS